MEPKDSNSSRIKIILLDIFPSFEDLENQDKKGLSIIFHGINKFYNLKELVSQKEEINIVPNLTQTKMAISIIQSTDILATGQMIIKHGTQWVTFSYENKEKLSQGNLVLNLMDCIKINILCEISNKNQNNTKKRNNSIEFPDKKDSKLNLNKKFENFKKTIKNNKLNKKNHNNSQENYNSELIESYNYFNATVKKKNSNDFNLNDQVLSTITKEHNKKYEINNNNNNMNNSLNCLYKQFNYNYNNLYSLKKLNTEKFLNNKKFKKRINNSAMNISGSETKTSNHNINLNNSNIKSSSRSKIDKKEENNGSLLSSTLKNFNFKNIRKKNNTFGKYLSSSENENNPNFQNYSINIDEILSDKIREHVNVEKSYSKSNCINTLFDKSKIKKPNNNNPYHLKSKLSSNGLVHAKTKTTNFINVNLNNNELSKTKLEKKQKSKIKFSKKKEILNLNKTNYNINNSQKYFSNNNSIKTKKNNNFNLEISTNSFLEDKNKDININKNNGLNLYSKDKKENYTISTKKNKKIMFNKEASSQPNNFIIHKSNNNNDINKSPNYNYLSDRNTERIINDYIVNDNDNDNVNENGNLNKNGNENDNGNDNNNEIEYNAYEKIKEDFNLVYNDEYINNIQEDLLKLEIELFIEKITELIKSYHDQIDLYNLENEIEKNNYRNSVRQYLFQWKLYNKLQYLKMIRESKIIHPFENKKQIKKNNVNKVDINQKEMVIFRTLFSNNKEDKKKMLKSIILNVLGNNDKNIKPLLRDFKFKNWMQQNINDCLK